MAVFMANRPEFVCVWLGLAKIGQKSSSFPSVFCVFMASRLEFVCVWLILAKIGQKSAFSFSFVCRLSNVADPDPDTHVFGPPGSGSFYHHAKIVRKTLIPTIL